MKRITPAIAGGVAAFIVMRIGGTADVTTAVILALIAGMLAAAVVDMIRTIM